MVCRLAFHDDEEVNDKHVDEDDVFTSYYSMRMIRMMMRRRMMRMRRMMMSLQVSIL